MLSDEEIWKFWWARPDVPDGEDDSMEAQFIAAARSIEREATAPLIKQIKEDEALMRDVLEAMTAEPEMREGACSVATEALRERLEAKK